MSEIDSTGPVRASQTDKLYRQEYQHGANLFEEALNQANKTSYDPKNEQFADVMKMAMEILNQTARGLKNEKLLKQNEKINEDFKAYQANPNKEHLDALRSELNQARDSLD